MAMPHNAADRLLKILKESGHPSLPGSTRTLTNFNYKKPCKHLPGRHIANKLAIKPKFDKNMIFCDNLIAVHMKKTQLKLGKPINLGANILDISKTLMYDFHYDYVKKDYGQKAKLLFTDTDSLCYEIETEDFYKPS